MKLLSREKSGIFGESLVFDKLISLGHSVEFARTNQKGFDLNTLDSKIEVKHIQRTGSSSNDSFILKGGQASPNSFNYLVLLISDCTNKSSISSLKYYIFSNQEIQSIISSKKKNLEGSYTFNLSNDGLRLAGRDLSKFHNKWKKIKN
ncbi:hypothetical protein ABH17_026875 (plasmid) [Bacillus toyonensis]|uniref:hypothetical protein n=1 Tax=Bacillus toyonensis TaxID=155322 RepID=UPI0006AA2A67|nr:hypothetical protein [Bacillus toyonensis]OKO50948.1 hypothetical protein ABH17_026875 [Bacillus toyonensis]